MTQHRKGFLPEEDFETDPASLVAVVVGRSSPGELTEILHERGWDVRHCPGPQLRRCPLVDGERCLLRERSDVAVLYVDAREQMDRNDASALVRCGAHATSPIVAVVAGDPTVMDPLEKTSVITAGTSSTDIANAAETAHRASFGD